MACKTLAAQQMLHLRLDPQELESRLNLEARSWSKSSDESRSTSKASSDSSDSLPQHRRSDHRARSEGSQPLASLAAARKGSEDVELEENERAETQDALPSLHIDDFDDVNTPFDWKRAVSHDTGLLTNRKGQLAVPEPHPGRIWKRWNSWLGGRLSRCVSEEGSNASRSTSPTDSVVDTFDGFSGLDELPAIGFEDTSQPMSVSGGTATFFRVKRRQGMRPPGEAEQLVGKDITHAKDEVQFYAKLQSAADRWQCWSEFAEVAMKSPGLARLSCGVPCACAHEHDEGAGCHCVTRPLLLLEDLHAGFEKLRLIDVKLGAETSVAGWKGKSRLHALKNACIDQRTNSATEGFRLEGIENPPPALQGRIAELMARSDFKGQTKLLGAKAIRRFALQRLRACDFLADWLDLSELGSGAELRSHRAVWSSLEVMECVRQAVASVPVPQQWIGSSLALGLEAAERSTAPPVVAKVFDWGRSELSTVEDWARLSPDEKRERLHYWRQYARAVARFQWELCRTAAQRCCCPSWAAVVLELRCEPLRLLRAALSGASEGDVIGVCLHELPAHGLSSQDRTALTLSLASRWNSRAEDHGPPSGKLHLNLSLPKGAAEGTTSIGLGLRRCTQVPGAEALASDGLVFVRAVAFERIDDAKRHMQATLVGNPEPQPRGRACVQTSAPGRAQGKSLLFEESRPLEFLALGRAAAAAAQARLLAALPASVRNGMPGRTSSTSWPPLLPPVLGTAAQADAAALAFCEQVFAWTDEAAECPAQWSTTACPSSQNIRMASTL